MATRTRTSLLAVLAFAALALCLAVPAGADVIHTGYHWGGTSPYYVNGHGHSGATVEFYTTKPYDGENWIGYCVDPTQRWNKKADYNIYGHDQLPDWSNPLSTAGTAMDAAWLMEKFAPGLQWLDDPSSVNYHKKSVRNRIDALQVAIWEAVLDPGNYNLTSGQFRVKRPWQESLAQDYLWALFQHKAQHGGNVVLSGNYTFTLGQSDKYQDLLFASNTPVGTPEPGAMLLMGSALAGLGFFRRRRREEED